MKLTLEQLENANECGCFECRNKVRTHIRTLQTERDAAVQGLKVAMEAISGSDSSVFEKHKRHTWDPLAHISDVTFAASECWEIQDALESAGAEP